MDKASDKSQGYRPRKELPHPISTSSSSSRWRRPTWPICLAFGPLAVLFTMSFHICGRLFHANHTASSLPLAKLQSGPFFSQISRMDDLCVGVTGPTPQHAGFIGLEGDTERTPRRSFFWYFEAEADAENAPLILTMGGGPGTTGMLNPLSGQSPCVVKENGTIPNPNRWTERFNLLAIDHPIGVGYSYGKHVNNSVSAAHDVYDFLQKFFQLFPHLAKNQFVISGGSYGGIYVPNIASVIHTNNLAIARGEGPAGAIPINLESLMLSNPFTDPMSYFRWDLHYRCAITHIYNATTCAKMYALLPTCLEATQLAFDRPSLENRLAAGALCYKLNAGDTHGVFLEDVRRNCVADGDDKIKNCFPAFAWVPEFMNDARTKEVLGIPSRLKFEAMASRVTREFHADGDQWHQHHKLYEPLLKDGIRLFHHIGGKDANVAWPGVLSFLKLLRTPFQEAFVAAPDVPWPEGSNSTTAPATLRVVGEGAGNMTYAVYDGAGHFVVSDQPALVKEFVERWVENRPFF
ncbi:Alpha/Beta hydrolase protein [Amylostereum chailletii]|nr:Alpha/Beta hydrolase protein [Amylostereum chailletii]